LIGNFRLKFPIKRTRLSSIRDCSGPWRHACAIDRFAAK
jgi:hypothetical protein